jgi:hypothetical protein
LPLGQPQEGGGPQVKDDVHNGSITGGGLQQ